MTTGRRQRGKALATYVRIAASVLGRDQLIQKPIAKPPRRLPEERPSLFRRHEDNARRHVLYAIRMARAVAHRYNIPLEGFGDFRFVELKNSSAAKVTTHGNRYFIEINRKFRDDMFGILSILAHEFAHVLLDQKKVRLADQKRNEFLTDTIAVLSGFGPIIKEACERKTTLLSVETTHYLGYLSRDEIEWLCLIQSLICNQLPFRVRAKVDPEKREYVICPACWSRLRLPQRSARMLLRCPRCGLIQALRLEIHSSKQGRFMLWDLIEKARRWLDTYHGVPE